MTVTTLANVVQTLQSDVLNILRADSASITITYPNGLTGTITLSDCKILDGVPMKTIWEGGFPLILVHTPEVEESRLTLTKHRSEMTTQIEILDKREGNVRVLVDAVKDALHNAQATTKGDGYYWYGRRVRSNINYSFLGGESDKPVWHASIFMTYFWSGV